MNILNIGTWSSSCESCGYECDPYEKFHNTNLGYSREIIQPGCGVEYTHITTYYHDLGTSVVNMRPDLIYIDQLGGLTKKI